MYDFIKEIKPHTNVAEEMQFPQISHDMELKILNLVTVFAHFYFLEH